MIDGSRPEDAAREAERLLAADPDDLAAACGLMLAGTSLGPQQFLAATDRLMSVLSRCLSRPVTPEQLRLAVEAADQAVRRAELFFARIDQRNFAPAVFAMLAEIARFVGDMGARLGDGDLERSGRAAERRYWFHRDPATQEVRRAYWHSDSPLQLQVETTNHCNLKCTMCPRTTTMTRPLGHMDLAVWERIIDTWSARDMRFDLLNPLTRRAAPARIRGGVRMYYLGEFLMHPEFERFVQIASERDCAVGIQTNGLLLLKRSVRQRLLDAVPANIGISIDGFDARSYENLRAGGRWDALKKGIELFLQERKERGLEDRIGIGIATILAEDNEAARERTRQFLSTIGDGSLPISFLPLTTNHPTDFIDSMGNIVTYDYSPLHQVDPNYPSCHEPLQKMTILWDGNVGACCVDPDGVIRVGHAGMGVDEVWNGVENRRLKEAHLHHDLSAFPTCQACLGVDASCRSLPRA
jgi:hypothetical protein